MAVVNLGSLQRQGSMLSGLSEALKMREDSRHNRAIEKAQESALSSQLASQTLRKREQDIKNVSDTHKRFSVWWNGMSEQEKSIAKTSEQYKELHKFFKGFSSLVPGIVDDKGEIVPALNTTMYKDKLSEAQAKSKLKIADGIGTAADFQLLRLTDDDKSAIATKLEAAEKLANKGDKVSLMENIRNMLSGGAKQSAQQQPQATAPLQQGLAQPVGAATAPQVTQPIRPVQPIQPVGNPNDPLGLLGR